MLSQKVIETGLLILLLTVQTVHLVVKRREARRMHDPQHDRRKTGWELQLLRRELRELKARIDKAGVEMSDLATKLQALPSELSRHFASLEMAQEWTNQCRADRARLQNEINQLRDALRYRDSA